MTVRFPNGQAVQYNDAMYVIWGEKHSSLYNKDPSKGGNLIARVPAECIIEWANPCRVYNPLTDNINEELKALSKEIRALRRKVERVKEGVSNKNGTRSNWNNKLHRR
jgi:hypothetical protein